MEVFHSGIGGYGARLGPGLRAAVRRFYRHRSPRFLRLFFRFVRTHPRMKLISYYQSAMLSPAFRLSLHPVSRGVLRRKLSSPKFLGAE